MSNVNVTGSRRRWGTAWPRGLGRGVAAALCLGALAALWRIWRLPSTQGDFFGLHSTRAIAQTLIVAYGLAWGVYFSLSRERWPSKLGHCLLATSTVVLLLGFLELPAVLGWVDYRFLVTPREHEIYGLHAWDNPRNRLDKELLHIHRPYERFVGEARGDLVGWLGIPTDQRYKVDIEYDSRGFRNDHEIDRAAIVVIGDSFAEAALVSQADLLSSRLERRFDVPVANLGQSGYGPQQELVVVRRFGLSLQPRFIVWLFFDGNDLLDVRRYEQTVRNWDRFVSERQGLWNRTFTRNALLVFGGRLAEVPERHAGRRSCKLFNHGGEDGTLYFAFGDGVPPSAFGGAPLSREEEDSFVKTQAILREADALARKNAATLVLAYVPAKWRVYHDLCEFPPDSHAKDWSLNDLPARLESWCADHGIPFVDLTPDLRAAAGRGELVFFPDDGHWNSKGNEVATETIARFFATRGWPRGAGAPGAEPTAARTFHLSTDD